MGFLAGDYTPHPNSLLFNAFPGFWPFKLYWFFRKVSEQPGILFTIVYFACRLERSSSCRTSPLLPRATPTNRCPASTSASLSTTEQTAIPTAT